MDLIQKYVPLDAHCSGFEIRLKEASRLDCSSSASDVVLGVVHRVIGGWEVESSDGYRLGVAQSLYDASKALSEYIDRFSKENRL